jgi:hypothetical protein
MNNNNSKQILIKSISNKLHTFFTNKYGEQFKSLQLDIKKINKIVSVKLEKEQITKSKIPSIINTLQETINKIVVKKIYDMNNSDVIIKPKEIKDKTNEEVKQEEKTQITLENQFNVFNNKQQDQQPQKNTLEIDNSIFTNLINQQELIKELDEKPKTDIKLELDLSSNDDLENMKNEYKEKFPMRERRNEVNQMKTLIPKKNLNFFLVVNSLERDKTIYNSPYKYKKPLDYLGKFKNIIIKKVTLINCIIKKTFQISTTPYITLNIKELGTEYYGTKQEDNNIFCYLDLYKKQNEFLYYECNNKTIEFTSGITIDGLTISLHLPNGQLLGETEPINSIKPIIRKDLEIQSLDDIEELDLNLKIDDKIDDKSIVKQQQNIKKQKKKKKNLNDDFNNQFIFNIEYEFNI